MLDKSIIHYLAGIIDGEGTICLNKKSGRLQLRVGMTDPEAICIFCKIFGTNMYSLKTKSGKTLYSFSLSGQKAYLALRKFANCLLVKRKKAFLCIKWFEEYDHFYLKLRENFEE